jgi:murein DD-endopeptidase MepM/ murein hydrolase activator NlpD
MKTPVLAEELTEFSQFFWKYFRARAYQLFTRFEASKGLVVDFLYRRRGKYARPFVHSGMVGLLFVGVTFGPVLITSQEGIEIPEGTTTQAVVLGVTVDPLNQDMATVSSSEVLAYRGGEIVDYSVQDGDTLGSIAEKFSLETQTILWANDLTEKSTIKPGQVLKIPPVDGVVHTVKKGETIYSIAKKYGLEDEAAAQGIVNYPFNTFVDDEKFSLAVGQTLVVPDGVVLRQAQDTVPISRQIARTPDAGAVSATGQFVWPAAGGISQGYKWYHKAIDISNRGGGPILAADSGTVVLAGWPDNYGYGNRVMIDHGNGLTGVHLHFEIRRGGVLENPLNYLR